MESQIREKVYVCEREGDRVCVCFTPDFFKFQYQASFKICFVVRQSLCVCYPKVLIWYVYLNY